MRSRTFILIGCAIGLILGGSCLAMSKHPNCGYTATPAPEAGAVGTSETGAVDDSSTG